MALHEKYCEEIDSGRPCLDCAAIPIGEAGYATVCLYFYRIGGNHVTLERELLKPGRAGKILRIPKCKERFSTEKSK